MSRTLKSSLSVSLLALTVAMIPRTARAVSSTVVISQVYPTGGNAGTVYKNDYIELFNLGSTPVDLTGWSVQYASATGTTWQTTALSGTLQPGQYFLVQEAAGTGGTTDLPTPDATGNIAMSGTAAKVALVSSTTALSGACPTSALVVDLVGYGSTASCSETMPVSPGSTATNSMQRTNGGCVDTDNNPADFAKLAADPHNKMATVHQCCSTIVCGASDQCHVTGTCDVTTSMCSNPPAMDGATCNDGDLCTTNDQCMAGVCGGAAVQCTPPDDCHTSACTAGVCVPAPKMNGASCNDSSVCTTNDQCTAGVCQGSAVACMPMDQCHVAGVCDPLMGCSNPAARDGTSCDDGDECTLDDGCEAGACAGTPMTCTPLDECHVAGTCAAGACSNPAAMDGTTCSVGKCVAGVCTATSTTSSTSSSTGSGMGGAGGQAATTGAATTGSGSSSSGAHTSTTSGAGGGGTNPSDGSGCSCRTSSGGDTGGAMASLAALGLIGLRVTRRRRGR
ncbi:MAG: lamin tail domain-containing protein [Polyangiaceae bacterium]